jgi:hypothetical protein
MELGVIVPVYNLKLRPFHLLPKINRCVVAGTVRGGIASSGLCAPLMLCGKIDKSIG